MSRKSFGFGRTCTEGAALALAALLAASAAVAQAPVVLVSNVGQTRHDGREIDRDLGQAFIVPPGPDVTLTRVDILLEVGSGPQEFSVNISAAVSATLTGPTGLSAGWQRVEFTAPPGGIALEADETYYVLLDANGATGGWKVGRQTYDLATGDRRNLDPGAREGWGMAQSVHRASDADPWEPDITRRLMIAIHGRAVAAPGAPAPPDRPPEFDSATVVRDRLAVTFDEELDSGSRPAGSAFAVRAGGRTIAGAGTARISGSVTTVSLASTVAAGERVTVSYDRPPGNPLRGKNGSAVAAFRDRAASNMTPPLPPEADFTVDSACADGLCRARTGETVTFTDESSGDVSRRSWDFYVPSTGPAPSGAVVRHAWSSPGFYEVTLTVRGAGRESEASRLFLVEASSPAGTCEPGPHTLCLRDSRYRVRAALTGPDGETLNAGVVHAGTNDSGLLWFHDRENWEVLVKVLDGCAINGADWVFVASATDLGFEMTVTDTANGQEWEYRNEPGAPSPAFADTAAFTNSCLPD